MKTPHNPGSMAVVDSGRRAQVEGTPHEVKVDPVGPIPAGPDPPTLWRFRHCVSIPTPTTAVPKITKKSGKSSPDHAVLVIRLTSQEQDRRGSLAS